VKEKWYFQGHDAACKTSGRVYTIPALDMTMNQGTLLILLTVLVAHSAPATNLLVNAGFETGNFTGWTTGGNSINSGVSTNGTAISGTSTSTTVAVRSGSFAGFAVIRCSDSAACQNLQLANESFTLTQTLAVQQNTSYDVGFYLGGSRGYGVDPRDNWLQIFIDGTGLLFDPMTEVVGDFAGFVPFQARFNSGSRTNVSVAFQITGSGQGRSGASFDDFFVQVSTVPEPSYAAVLGAALIAGWFMLRRDVRRTP
jgi:hypothetical protein